MAIVDRLPRLSQKKALVGTLALVSGAALVEQSLAAKLESGLLRTTYPK